LAGDNSIFAARLNAIRLKQMATDRVIHRMSLQTKLRSELEGLF
jgi:hypothetical protein